MKDTLIQLGRTIHQTVSPYIGNREITGRAADGDVLFKLDDIAEKGMKAGLEQIKMSGLRVAYFSEEEGRVIKLDDSPNYLFVIDPVDGSRPAKCGFPQWCVNLAVASYTENPTVGDVEFAFMKEANGTEYFAEKGKGAEIISPDATRKMIPSPSAQRKLDKSSLILEICGAEQAIVNYINTPLQTKAWPTGVFIVSSSSWAITQLVQGRIDGYVHPTKRIWNEFQEYRQKMLKEAGGKLKGLFPYDIAPWALIGKEAGLVLTDSYGNSLDDMSLTDISAENQRCTIAAGTPELHKILVDTVAERIEKLKSNKPFLEELIES